MGRADQADDIERMRQVTKDQDGDDSDGEDGEGATHGRSLRVGEGLTDREAGGAACRR